MFFTRYILFFVLVKGILCVSTKMKVIAPDTTLSGRNVTLGCSYDLEGDQLYTVKWHKDGTEFYKFTPREDPSKKRFNVLGLDVALESSNATHVTLRRVTYGNGGVYSCEVTADAPSFFMNTAKATLRVIDPPAQGPQITGMKSKYRPGELLKAECVTRGSRPAANLTWLINGQPVDPARIRHNKLFQSHAGLSIQSGLRMHITQETVSEGRFSVSCTATIYDVYKQSCEKSVEFSRPGHKPGGGGGNTSSRTRTGGTASDPPSPTPQSSNNLYYALPAARQPETTLFFTIEDGIGGGPTTEPRCFVLYFIHNLILVFLFII